MVHTPFGASNWIAGNNTSAIQRYDTMGRLNCGWLCQGNNGATSPAFCPGNSQMYGFSLQRSGPRVTGRCDTVLQDCNSIGYDEFDRVTSVSGGNNNFSWAYDRWGNRTVQNGSPSVTMSVDGNTNHLTGSGFSYDAAGNQTGDGLHSYTYDAEGKVLRVDGGSTANPFTS